MNIHEDLKAWVDGELSPERAEEVRLAVESNPALQQEVQFMKIIGSNIQAAAVDAEVRGAEKALERARRGGFWSRMATWQRVLATGGGALAVIAMVSLVTSVQYPQAREAAKRPGGIDSGLTFGVTSDPDASFAGQVPVEAPATSGEAKAPSRKQGDGMVAPESASPAKGKVMGGASNSATPPSPVVSNLATRQIIKTASMTVRVETVREAQAQVEQIATSFGGFVTSSSLSGGEYEQPVGDTTIRVPVKQFDAVIKKISTLGIVLNPNISGEDVTAQIADVTARIRVMRAEEDSYVSMLRAARKVGELLEIRERLSMVRQQIESLEAQQASLKDLSAMSTINVHLEQKPKIDKPKPEEDWSDATFAGAVNTLKDVGRFLGRGIIYLFVMAPIWIPIVIILWIIARKLR